MGGLWGTLPIFAVLVAAALVGVEAKKPALFAVSKPTATLSLLLVVGATPGAFAWQVSVGLVLAAVGDAVLISDKPAAFVTGLVLFLLAHISYAIGFATGMAQSGRLLSIVAAALVALASSVLVRRLWLGLGPSLRGPMIAYAAAITAMVGAAFLSIGGSWTPRVTGAVAAGAFLFYVSDANLAWNRFARAYPHGQTVTLSLYWAGQLGVALAARWAHG